MSLHPVYTKQAWKIWNKVLGDVRQQNVVCRVQVYTGRQLETARETNQGQCVVQELCRNLVGSGRNVTCDHFFTSLQLIQNLKKEKNDTSGYCAQKQI